MKIAELLNQLFSQYLSVESSQKIGLFWGHGLKSLGTLALDYSRQSLRRLVTEKGSSSFK